MIFLWKDKERYILNLFEKGDHRAMDKFYEEYADYLNGICARYISDEDMLKDVVQESFIKIFTRIREFEYRGKGSLNAWVTKIAVNASQAVLPRILFPFPASLTIQKSFLKKEPAS